MPVFEEKLINPLAVRFTQEHIRTTFRDGRPVEPTIDEIETELGNGDYDVILRAPFPHIEIIRWRPPHASRSSCDTDVSRCEDAQSYHWFTLDNRRLYCLQRAAVALLPKRAAAIVEILYADDGHVRRKYDSETKGLSVHITVSTRAPAGARLWAWRDVAIPVGRCTVLDYYKGQQAQKAMRMDDMKNEVEALQETPQGAAAAASSSEDRLGVALIASEHGDGLVQKEALLSKDDVVQVGTSFVCSCLSGIDVTLAVGDEGRVTHVTDGGDVMIKFDNYEEEQLVFTWDFPNLRSKDVRPQMLKGRNKIPAAYQEQFGTSEAVESGEVLDNSSNPTESEDEKKEKDAERAWDDASCPTPSTTDEASSTEEDLADLAAPASEVAEESSRSPNSTSVDVHTEEPKSAFELLRACLEDVSWSGRRGETYDLSFTSAPYWNCVRWDKAGTKKFTITYDEDYHLVYWGLDKAYYFDASEVDPQSDEITWYAYSDWDKRKARFVWIRPKTKTVNETIGDDTLVASAIDEIKWLIADPGFEGYLWIPHWDSYYYAKLGSLRSFVESYPDEFVVTPAGGRWFTVAATKGVGSNRDPVGPPQHQGARTKVWVESKSTRLETKRWMPVSSRA